MSIQDKIAALPEWPKGGVPAHGSLGAVIALEHGAALARLALAREWMDDADHHAECNAAAWDDDGPYTRTGAPCTCGRDALLAALERKP